MILTRKGLQPETPYHTGTGQYLWSPDGVGCYYYDTREALETAHGVVEDDEWVEVVLSRTFDVE